MLSFYFTSGRGEERGQRKKEIYTTLKKGTITNYHLYKLANYSYAGQNMGRKNKRKRKIRLTYIYKHIVCDTDGLAFQLYCFFVLLMIIRIERA